MNAVNPGSVLARSSGADVVRDPYPHIVVDQVFDEATYRRLAESFPPAEWFLRHLKEVKNNQAVRIPAAAVLENPKFSPEWREFFRYHTSQDFWNDILRVFGEDMLRIYPDIEKRAGKPLEKWQTKLRSAPGEADINMDLLFVINTPVTRPTSVRPAHVDSEYKIFTGLFYMKPEDDPTPGGDLELFRAAKPELRFGGHYADERELERVRTVEYTANRFLAFVNCLDSIHGVTPRPVTDRIRRYVNFVVETPFKAFELRPLPIHRQLLLSLRQRWGKAPGVTLPADAEI